MRKVSFYLLIFIYMFNIVLANNVLAAEEPEIECPYAGVYMFDDLELLYGKEENKVISIASITKLMTAIVSVENIEDLNETVVIDYDIVSKSIEDDYAVAGIEDGQELTYYDLLATMLIPSGADSAVYLGNIVFNDMDKFVEKMNEKAQDLGMKDSHFANVIGIDDEQNFSTINDVAKMLKYAIENDTIKTLISTKEYTTSDGKLTVDSSMNTIATRRGIDLKYTLGGKTGTTGDAGLCLASYAEDEGNILLCITAGIDMYSRVPYNVVDTEKLYDYIANIYSYKNVLSKGDLLLELDTVYAEQDKAQIYLKENVIEYTGDIQKEDIRIEYNGKKEVSPMTKQGTILGTADIYYKNEKLKTVDAVFEQKLNFSFEKWFSKNWIYIVIVVLMILCVLVMFRKIINKKQYVNIDRKKS